MLEWFFFILGIVNSIFLITIFILRKNKLDLILRFGWIYLLLAVPAAGGIFLAFQENGPRYAIFLAIFLAYLLLEWLFDHVVSPGFRESWRQNWKCLTPYLVLYYAMNYGFVVMPWKHNLTWGIIMLVLFILQVATNRWSHSNTRR